MVIKLSIVGMLAIGMVVLRAGAAEGQNYPNKPIRIVTAEAGGGNDFTARLVAPGLSANLGQQVIIDNRNSVIAPELVAKAPPDGYTLHINGVILWITPLLQTTRYDPVRDYSPVSRMVTAPSILVVHPSVAANSVKELIALAKAKPGALNYASTGSVGSAPQLASELFKSMAGVNIVHVPYKGSGPALIGLLAGEVQLIFSTGGVVMPHVKAGKLRALAVASLQPSALYPGLPTVAESGLPGFENSNSYSLLAPANAPPAIVNRLNQEIVRVLSQADVKQKFLDSGVEVVASSPEQLGATIKSDMVRMGKVIKDAGIRAE